MHPVARPEGFSEPTGDRLTAPAALRNLAPIAAVLDGALPTRGRALELASGTGQHIAAHAARWPLIDWQPSDVNADLFPSIAAWCAGLANVRPPVTLDATAPGWSARHGGQDVILLVNLLHLIRDAACNTLLSELPLALAPGGLAALYGPFRRAGRLISEGDIAFDARLRAADPLTGYKEADTVQSRLAAAGLTVQRIDMPAANLMLLARRPL
jgi:SAM-dependent methyltransferase